MRSPGPVPTKMGFDTLSQILNGLGAIGLYLCIIEGQLWSGIFGVISILLALVVLFFRNNWNEKRKTIKISPNLR